jgi:hypothetical protein
MAKHIQDLTFHIQTDFFSVSPIGRVRLRITENTPKSPIAIHIMEVSRWSPMSIHDVVGKSAICYLHHEGA